MFRRPNVSEVLLDRALGAHALTIIRTRGAWADGRFEKEQVRMPVYGSVQSAPGAEVAARPEGGRAEDALILRTTERLFATGTEPGAIGDEIEYGGARYKVTKVCDWSAYGYTEAHLVRK